MEKIYLPQVDSSLFDFYTWEAGSLLVLGLQTRTNCILLNRKKVQEHAIGWANGISLPCRPKENCRGVMFEKDGERFWTHLFEDEFIALFKCDNL